MRRIAAAAAGLALSTACLVPTPGLAQAAAPRSLTPEESEAYQMSLTLAGSCSPSRQVAMGGSESVIRRPEPLDGTAAFLHSVDGTFLVLERYNESSEGHCLVLGWFGDDLQPGRYTIEELGMGAMEAEVGSGAHSFFGMFAVRSSAESMVFVAESGGVELTTVEPGRVTGRFQLSGFVVQQSNRTRAMTMDGSFTALAAPQE